VIHQDIDPVAAQQRLAGHGASLCPTLHQSFQPGLFFFRGQQLSGVVDDIFLHSIQVFDDLREVNVLFA